MRLRGSEVGVWQSQLRRRERAAQGQHADCGRRAPCSGSWSDGQGGSDTLDGCGGTPGCGLGLDLIRPVDDCGRRAAGSSPRQVEVAISNLGIKPQGLTIAVGTMVDRTNQDSARHTVTSDVGDWDSGQLAQGPSWSRTFDEGAFAYHCADHPSMMGTIQVTRRDARGA